MTNNQKKAAEVVPHPDSLKSHLTGPTSSNTSENTREQREISVAGYSIFYRSMWLVMSLLSLVWGMMLGLRFSGFELLGPSTIATGSVVLVSLLLALFVVGRPRCSRH